MRTPEVYIPGQQKNSLGRIEQSNTVNASRIGGVKLRALEAKQPIQQPVVVAEPDIIPETTVSTDESLTRERKLTLRKSAAALLSVALGAFNFIAPATAGAQSPFQNTENLSSWSSSDKILPLDITSPDGKIYNGETLANLGIASEPRGSSNFVQDIWTGRIISVNQIDNGPSAKPEYSISIVIGKYQDGSPVIVDLNLGSIGDIWFEERTHLFRNFRTQSSEEVKNHSGINYRLIEELVILAQRNAQIGIIVPQVLENSALPPSNTSDPILMQVREELIQGRSFIQYNVDLKKALKKAEDSNRVFTEEFTSDLEGGWASGIIFFEPIMSDPSIQDNICKIPIFSPC